MDKDYTCNIAWAKRLARSIEQYHHLRGETWVRVWIETDKEYYKLPIYSIRSNLKLTPLKEADDRSLRIPQTCDG